jgi:hypothetical protein
VGVQQGVMYESKPENGPNSEPHPHQTIHPRPRSQPSPPCWSTSTNQTDPACQSLGPEQNEWVCTVSEWVVLCNVEREALGIGDTKVDRN